MIFTIIIQNFIIFSENHESKKNNFEFFSVSQVGDMISVIDMPPAEESVWWRGKRGFQVGFFPYECVQVIGDKVRVLFF